MEWIPERRKTVNTCVNTSIPPDQYFCQYHIVLTVFRQSFHDIDNNIERVRPAIEFLCLKLIQEELTYYCQQLWYIPGPIFGNIKRECRSPCGARE